MIAADTSTWIAFLEGAPGPTRNCLTRLWQITDY